MKNWLKFALTSFALVLQSSCTQIEKEKDKFVEPEWVDSPQAFEVFATGNFNGALISTQKIFHKQEKEPLWYGGAELLLAYREIIEHRTPHKNLFFDTGNFFDSRADAIHHKATALLLRRLNYDAVLFGHQEIQELGNPPQFASNISFINSHLFDLSSGKPYQNENMRPWRMVEKNGKKFGVMAIDDEGLSANKQILGLYFEDAVLGVLRQKNELKRAGADVIILLAKIQTDCHLSSNSNLSCAKNDRLYQLLSRLPPKTVDLVITNSPSLETGTLFQTSILFAPDPGLGHWLSRARIQFDDANQANVTLLPPLAVCDRFFHLSGDCHHPFDNEGINQKRAAKFWGYEIVRDEDFSHQLQLIRTQGSPSPASK